MRRLAVAFTLFLAIVPAFASAARSASTFRVGIAIEHDCTVARSPDGGDVALGCSAGTAATPVVRSLAAGQASPRPSRRDGVAPSRLHEVSEGDASRLVVVEY